MITRLVKRQLNERYFSIRSELALTKPPAVNELSQVIQLKQTPQTIVCLLDRG